MLIVSALSSIDTLEKASVRSGPFSTVAAMSTFEGKPDSQRVVHREKLVRSNRAALRALGLNDHSCPDAEAITWDCPARSFDPNLAQSLCTLSARRVPARST